MQDKKKDMGENVLHAFDDISTAFESDKTVKLYNCQNFYVRMFNKAGDKRYTKVSELPSSGWWVPVTTRNEEFSLYDKNGAEKCVVIFPWHRYLKNKHFDDDNKDKKFKVEWVGNLECHITYLKRSFEIWLYSCVFLILSIIALVSVLN